MAVSLIVFVSLQVHASVYQLFVCMEGFIVHKILASLTVYHSLASTDNCSMYSENTGSFDTDFHYSEELLGVTDL